MNNSLNHLNHDFTETFFLHGRNYFWDIHGLGGLPSLLRVSSARLLAFYPPRILSSGSKTSVLEAKA